ncbi:MAG: hypothetical protein H9W83_08945 [Leuconostoc sp.]|nr:hypothetical protein [Leuconostoc sp.]
MKQQDFYMQQVFDDISYFHVNVTHKGVPTNWYLDDLRVDWTDNSCEAGRCREHHRFGSFGGGLGEGIWCL